MNAASRQSVLVIGGNRLFGRDIVRSCVGVGLTVSVLNRGTMRGASYAAPVEIITCDRDDALAFRNALAHRRFDVVIDNICYRPYQAEMVLDNLRSRCEHLIMTSSVMSYLNQYISGKILREDSWGSDCDGAGMDEMYGAGEIEYGRNKRACEQLLLSQSDVAVTVLRLHNVVGEDDFSGKSDAVIGAVARGQELRGFAYDRFQQVYAGDLGPIFAKFAAGPSPQANEAYNVAAEPIALAAYAAHLNKTHLPIRFGGETEGVAPFPRNVIMNIDKFNRRLPGMLRTYSDFLPVMAKAWCKRTGERDAARP